MNRHLMSFCLALLLAAVATSTFAYTIYLKDGSSLLAREKYRIEEDKAIITLQNGTQTFIEASEIDIQRTDRANQGQRGTALILEDGKVVEGPIGSTETRQKRLTDLAAKRDTSSRTRPQARRQTVGSSAPTDLPRTRAGAIDLTQFPRKPYSDLEVAAEASRFLRTLGAGEFQVFQGTQTKSAFIEMTTNSEASVFRNLEAAADTLLHLRNRYPNEVESVELLMSTSSRERAGQFVLTPSDAQALADKRIEPSSFFIQRVQF
jgi:hypothetical protein